ncbi:hypothetical protein NQZ68_036244 [Dissostichus eleginoides]|nr:hypothetical protein NQZ68_036244 [Dissostichus eleginoides]
MELGLSGVRKQQQQLKRSQQNLAQQKRTKEGLGPVLAGQRGSAHRTDMKMSGFIRQHSGTRGDGGNSATGTGRGRCHARRPLTDLKRFI